MSDKGQNVKELEQQLEAAKEELSDWLEQYSTREDGSSASDRRFEDRTERLREQVSDLASRIYALKHESASPD
ncbi:hypothetical protein ALO95_200360 [Pseudomonas syringae pv. antirrhini]|uniref:hypothetical protein n=1 Tax=Pseudomonas syringae group genomosp. 3 TaxID=251701 RepID=UPI000EFCCE8B|nr:hypothetical protein [Pseudomonas syringae group genomosp. 3]RMP45664.1 hypothetical protein ALQ23_200359 [Pseudomonas syringae pv. antirrhini]RMW21501.1 hypothetical protein ALO95_200360 [Pseudomonas syringae pv. antirrhini]